MYKATKEQIAEWKEKYGGVFKIKVEDESGDKVCYLKKPSRKVLGMATVAGKDNPIKFNETVIRECWLGGDEDIKTDDTLFLSASGKIPEIIETRQAELEKL
ncbi:MAG: hypothetical protein LBJ04_24460 [Sphingobacterium sp.]|jgi:hypothetical protein|nr:hypothetical protein [Sphingobacterium sp.]